LRGLIGTGWFWPLVAGFENAVAEIEMSRPFGTLKNYPPNQFNVPISFIHKQSYEPRITSRPGCAIFGFPIGYSGI
jgi:hypothetical protein